MQSSAVTDAVSLQYVEFAGLEGDLDEDEGAPTPENELGLQLPNPNASRASTHESKSLEALLATKNKRILEELTKFRVGHHSSLIFGALMPMHQS